MRLTSLVVTTTAALAALAAPTPARATEHTATMSKPTTATTSARRYCAPEVSELSERVCYFDGGAPSDARRTLVVYLHGALPTRSGVAYLQQRAMAFFAKRHGFTVLMPASPDVGGFNVWPRSTDAEAHYEASVVTGVRDARARLERDAGRPFDETFVVGFSSGAYYASSLAVRDALEDVDGYMILAGGSEQPTPFRVPAAERTPVFVGVSAADRTTANGARSLAGQLAHLEWPSRVEEQNAGHLVDWTLMAHGMAWLRAQARPGEAASQPSARRSLAPTRDGT